MSTHFDRSAATWDKGDLKQTLAQKSAEAILATVSLNPNMHLMDFGAGTGLLSFKIAPHVASVTGVDTSEKMLEQLEAKNTPQLHVQTYLGDITHMPLEERFDGIISAMAMHHVPSTEGFLRTLYAHLLPGGFIAIADLDSEDGTFHPPGIEGVFHHGFEREALAASLKECGFSEVRFADVLSVEKNAKQYGIFLVYARKV